MAAVVSFVLNHRLNATVFAENQRRCTEQFIFFLFIYLLFQRSIRVDLEFVIR